jgi:hypothetical protein
MGKYPVGSDQEEYRAFVDTLKSGSQNADTFQSVVTDLTTNTDQTIQSVIEGTYVPEVEDVSTVVDITGLGEIEQWERDLGIEEPGVFTAEELENMPAPAAITLPTRIPTPTDPEWGSPEQQLQLKRERAGFDLEQLTTEQEALNMDPITGKPLPVKGILSSTDHTVRTQEDEVFARYNVDPNVTSKKAIVGESLFGDPGTELWHANMQSLNTTGRRLDPVEAAQIKSKEFYAKHGDDVQFDASGVPIAVSGDASVYPVNIDTYDPSGSLVDTKTMDKKELVKHLPKTGAEKRLRALFGDEYPLETLKDDGTPSFDQIESIMDEKKSQVPNLEDLYNEELTKPALQGSGNLASVDGFIPQDVEVPDAEPGLVGEAFKLGGKTLNSLKTVQDMSRIGQTLTNEEASNADKAIAGTQGVKMLADMAAKKAGKETAAQIGSKALTKKGYEQLTKEGVKMGGKAAVGTAAGGVIGGYTMVTEGKAAGESWEEGDYDEAILHGISSISGGLQTAGAGMMLTGVGAPLGAVLYGVGTAASLISSGAQMLESLFGGDDTAQAEEAPKQKFNATQYLNSIRRSRYDGRAYA